jgi:hypothetical protein
MKQIAHRFNIAMNWIVKFVVFAIAIGGIIVIKTNDDPSQAVLVFGFAAVVWGVWSGIQWVITGRTSH